MITKVTRVWVFTNIHDERVEVRITPPGNTSFSMRDVWNIMRDCNLDTHEWNFSSIMQVKS